MPALLLPTSPLAAYNRPTPMSSYDNVQHLLHLMVSEVQQHAREMALGTRNVSYYLRARAHAVDISFYDCSLSSMESLDVLTFLDGEETTLLTDSVNPAAAQKNFRDIFAGVRRRAELNMQMPHQKG